MQFPDGFRQRHCNISAVFRDAEYADMGRVACLSQRDELQAGAANCLGGNSDVQDSESPVAVNTKSLPFKSAAHTGYLQLPV